MKKRRFAISWIWNMKNSTDKKRNYFGFFSRQYEIWKLFHIGVKQWKLYFNTYQDSFEKRRKNPNPWILLVAKLLNNPNPWILHFAKLRNNPDILIPESGIILKRIRIISRSRIQIWTPLIKLVIKFIIIYYYILYDIW